MAQQPTPINKRILICQQIFRDEVTREFTLSSLIFHVDSKSYPLTEELSIYAAWSNAKGVYTVEVQLQRDDGRIVWRQTREQPLEAQDVRSVSEFSIPHLNITFPEPGKYDLVLLGNGQEVSRQEFCAYRGDPPEVRTYIAQSSRSERPSAS